MTLATEIGLYRRKDDPVALDSYDKLALAKRSLTSDPHLNLAIFLLEGMPTYRRAAWMHQNMPRTMAMMEFLHLDPMFLQGKRNRSRTKSDERDLYDGSR